MKKMKEANLGVKWPRTISLALFAGLLFLAGCTKEEKEIEPPKIKCKEEISIEKDSEFNIQKWCKFDGNVTVDEFDTSVSGKHTVKVVVENENGITLKTLEVNVDGEVAAETPEPVKTPEPTATPTPTPTPTPKPTETPKPTATPTPKPVATPVPQTPAPTPIPTPVPTLVPQPQIAHGSETFSFYNYGPDGAYNACVTRLNQIGYGSCYPNSTQDAYILEY